MEARNRPEMTDAVKVCVRVRPLNTKERQDQTKSCIRIAASADGLSSNNKADPNAPQQLIVGKDRAFTFDTVFGIDSSQSDVYRTMIEPLVDGFLEGYNATVLAYGQTGTGRTHTMSGTSVDPKGGKNEEHQGIIPRVIRAVFEKMQENQQKREFSLRVEYIEIYNEELRDLLHPDTPTKQLSIREDGEGNIITAGVKSETAQTKEAVFRLLSIGGSSRVTGSTLMNEQSSRSHAIFSLLLQQRDLVTGECRKAKFHLVDLAGSERAKRTGAVAGRFKESVSINQGLLALGNVISALGDERRRQGTAERAERALNATSAKDLTTQPATANIHVPYRDSKLTRLLQDSLGGNAKTLMIACVSPATINFEETLNTLKYANRAKNIKNRPIVNQQTQEEKLRADDEISRMKEEIAQLQSQLQQTHAPPTDTSRPNTSSNGRRRHSMATVSTSTAVPLQEITSDQELPILKKRVRVFTEAIEAIRAHNVEAITALVALERDVKSLGRPVQQRLNEIVKSLNSAIQTANSSTSAHLTNKSRDGVSGVLSVEHGPEEDSPEDETIRRLTKDLLDAKADLARDEQIFEMKNAEILRLQGFITEAKEKNEKLIQRVQELERSGQLWSNAGVGGVSATNLPPPVQNGTGNQGTDDEAGDDEPPTRLPVSREGTATSKRSTSSRGLFTKRAGTASFQPEEDNVLIGTVDEDDSTIENRGRPSKSRGSVAATRPPEQRPGSGVVGRRGSLDSGDRHGEQMTRLEKTIVTLRTRVEELQQQNGELQHGKEESIRRWQLERQQYERQINDAEQAIETLRKANQTLEDALIDHRDVPCSPPSLRESRGQASKLANRAEIVIDERGEQDKDAKPSIMRSSHLSTPTTQSVTGPEIKAQAIADFVAFFDDSVRQLIEYNDAREQVLQVLKAKKTAQLNREEAHRRINALEMQKLRQSLSVRESIVDVSQSLKIINEKLHHEHRTLEELERLKKLKDRAEKKLRSLRRQEESGEFLDKETQQELSDLVELIDDLNSHISFQDSELQTAREDLDSIKQRSQIASNSPLESIAQVVFQRIRLGDPVAASGLIQKCVDDVARLRIRERDLLIELKGGAEAIHEREAALNQLETGLVAARKEFDRRLQLQQQESNEAIRALESQVRELEGQCDHLRQREKLQPQDVDEESKALRDEEWQKLIVSTQKKDEYITDLEKHVVFYKSKAKQMQMQLQQLLRESTGNQSDSHELQEDNARLQRRIQQLEEANDSLMKDLATAKVYLRLSKSQSGATEGVHVVRVSKSDLRELARPPTATSSSSPSGRRS